MMAKIKLFLRKIRKNIIEYITTNRLFIAYTIIALTGLVLIRAFTIGNALDFKTFIVDFALVLMIGSLGYLVKPKKQFNYFFIVLIIFSIMEVVNTIYYSFYYSFASFGELGTASQTRTVMGSIFEKLEWQQVIYIIFPIIFYLIYKLISRKNYINYLSIIEKGKRMCVNTLLVGCIMLAYTFVTATKTDYSRLAKQWDRVLVVERFGLVLYQSNDLIQTLTPKINKLFGYEKSMQLFDQYYTSPERDEYQGKNKYTNILKDKNIIFIHMEGIETFLMDVNFNGVDAVPNIKKLASEGMFFENFYPQISIGTSSDTEFTLLTSLMPAQIGTVFSQYYDRDYITIPKLLKEKDYYTFSMHGNLKAMWNRDDVHPSLGYDEMYFKERFTFNDDCKDPDNMECITLGINDKMFFEQAMPMLEDIEASHEKYMGTIITLSNHSPFNGGKKYGEYDLSSTFKDCDQDGNCSLVTTDYLRTNKYGSAVGNYLTSAHYADEALGEFFKYVNESDYFNDTVFVLYGDHDVKLTRNQKNYFYNYDYKTGELKSEDDPTYIEYDSYDHELNKKTPLIIWTKNKNLRSKLNGTVSYTMGMYDVAPTLGNMLGIKNEFALGHDIFNIKNNNFVPFPSGNFVTNLIYYNNSTGQSKIIKEGAELSSDYISNYITKTENILEVSNGIIVHDLIKTEKDKVLAIKENGETK